MTSDVGRASDTAVGLVTLRPRTRTATVRCYRRGLARAAAARRRSFGGIPAAELADRAGRRHVSAEIAPGQAWARRKVCRGVYVTETLQRNPAGESPAR